MAASPLADRLLVATPLIGDDTFRRTVIAVLAHSEDGALGVVLNRPTDMPVSAALGAWGERAAAPGVVFVGGPVAEDSLIGLSAEGAVDLHDDPDDALGPPGEVRIFAGQAGWAPGQLEAEIAEQAWWVVDPAPEDRLTRDPDGLWSRVLRRQPPPVGWFANLPEDLRTG